MPWTGQYIIGIAGAESTDDIEQAFYDGVIDANTKAVAEGRIRDSISNVVDIDLFTGGLTAESVSLGETYTYTDSIYSLMVVHNTTISKNSEGKVQISQYNTPALYYEGTKGVALASSDTQKLNEGLHPWEDRYIQSDPKGSQKTAIRLWNTTLDALFPAKDSNFLLDPESYPTEFNAADYPDPDEYPERYEGYTGTALQKKQQLWRDTVYALTKKGAQQTGDCLRARRASSPTSTKP